MSTVNQGTGVAISIRAPGIHPCCAQSDLQASSGCPSNKLVHRRRAWSPLTPEDVKAQETMEISQKCPLKLVIYFP